MKTQHDASDWRRSTKRGRRLRGGFGAGSVSLGRLASASSSAPPVTFDVSVSLLLEVEGSASAGRLPRRSR